MFPSQQLDETLLKKSVNYAKSFKNRYHFSELIPFNDNFLSGSWDGVYGLLIFDNSQTKINNLKSKVAIFHYIQNEEETNVFNFPYNIQQEIIKPILDKNRYFSNHNFISNSKCGSFLTFTSDHIIPEECLDKTKWTEHSCSETNLTPLQFLKVMTAISEREDRDTILSFRNEKIKKNVQSSYLESIQTGQHLEMPFKLHLYGNDDLSYVKLFATEQEAWDCYLKLKELSQTQSSGSDIMNILGFVYNN